MANKNFILKFLNGLTQDSPVQAIPDPVTNQEIPAGQAANSQTSPSTKGLLEKKISKLILSLAISIPVYLLAGYLLSRHGVKPFLSHLFGYALGLMFLAYINSIFESKIDMSKPVMLLMTIMLFYDLSVIFLPEYGKEKNVDRIESQRFEIIHLEKSDSTYTTKKVFYKGQIIKIISNGDVYETDGGSWQKYLGPGEHSETLNSTGNLAFKAGSSATVKIVY